MLNIKKTLTKILGLRIVRVTASSATSVAANGGTAWLRADIPANIKPICVCGYYLSGGSGCTVYNMALGHDSQGDYASFAVRNAQSTANSVTLNADILTWGGVFNKQYYVNPLTPCYKGVGVC